MGRPAVVHRRRERRCTCEVAFVGLVSGGLTTTAAVRELAALSPDITAMPNSAEQDDRL